MLNTGSSHNLKLQRVNSKSTDKIINENKLISEKNSKNDTNTNLINLNSEYNSNNKLIPTNTNFCNNDIMEKINYMKLIENKFKALSSTKSSRSLCEEFTDSNTYTRSYFNEEDSINSSDYELSVIEEGEKYSYTHGSYSDDEVTDLNKSLIKFTMEVKVDINLFINKFNGIKKLLNKNKQEFSMKGVISAFINSNNK